jgi:catechol 2,3-dioxygenase
VTDLGRSRAFYVDTLGLQVTDETADASTCARWRNAATIASPAQGGCGGVEVLGFKVWDEGDLDRAHAWFSAQGLPVAWVERPHQGRTLRTSDLFGVPLEFYAHMDRLPPIHQKYALYRGVKPLRIDHFNTVLPDVDASVGFWNAMGFRVTEYTEDEVTGRLWAAWMHRKGGRA